MAMRVFTVSQVANSGAEAAGYPASGAEIRAQRVARLTMRLRLDKGPVKYEDIPYFTGP
ncbi:hypothetical protein D9M70_569340 [compost metagenome]